MENNLWNIREQEKVCVFDLDDVLAKSIENWIEYVNTKLGTSYADLDEVKSAIPYSKYKNMKIEYRNSEEKLNIKPMEFASLITNKLKEAGYIIVILTRRPLFIHKNLFSLTKKWLEKNNITYDVLLFEEKKHLKIISDIENISFFVEDNRYVANSVGKFGIKTYLLNNKYNNGQLCNNVMRVNTLKDILIMERR